MTKSATDVMQEILISTVLDSVMALKDASKGLPNNLLRDLNAIHANTTFADLPAELQAAITASVRAAFTRLLREGYSVAPGRAEPARDARPPQRDARPPTGRPQRRPDARSPGGDRGRPPGDRGKPGSGGDRGRPPGGERGKPRPGGEGGGKPRPGGGGPRGKRPPR
jgi:hypothetical protein